MLTQLARKAGKAAALPFGLGRRRQQDLVITLYHRVGEGGAEIELPAAELDWQVERLSASGRVRSLDDALRDREGGVVVTFDDGTRDFHEEALPILVRHGVPALLYLATGFVAEEREEPSADAISWSQVREAVSTGLVTVGSHTHSHRHLGRATLEECREEMERSRDLIEDRLGVRCRHFAYPYCAWSAAAEWVSRDLFESSALHAWQTNRVRELDPHRLGRVPVLRSDGRAFFRAKVAGLLNAEGLLYRAMGRGPWRSA